MLVERCHVAAPRTALVQVTLTEDVAANRPKIDQVTTLVEHHMARVEELYEVKENLNLVARAVRNIALMDDVAAMQAEQERIKKARARNAELIKALDGALKGQEERTLLAKVQGIRVRQLVAKLGDFRGAAAQGFARTDLFIVERPGGDFTVSASAYETEAKSKARKCPPFEALLAAAQAGGEVGFDGPRHAGEQRLRVLRPGWVERLVGSLANEPILELSALLETRDWEAPPS